MERRTFTIGNETYTGTIAASEAADYPREHFEKIRALGERALREYARVRAIAGRPRAAPVSVCMIPRAARAMIDRYFGPGVVRFVLVVREDEEHVRFIPEGTRDYRRNLGGANDGVPF